MGRRGYPPPKHLAAKLLAIRTSLGLSQPKMAKLLVGDSYRLFYSRLYEFERGRRTPSLQVLLAYARAAEIPLEFLIDDQMELPF
jgi:transcriptional regulator with XRE-family HTH domain